MSYLCEAKKFRTVITFKNYFEDFLDGQLPQVRRKILQILRLIEGLEIIPQNHLKHIKGTKGLYEIRVVLGKGLFRIFCFFDEEKLVVLLSGFQKKSRKTPKKELEKAMKLKDQYYTEKRQESAALLKKSNNR
ncbi:MAG: type II toxin-antitoxin system RelE/ParE family toxin [Bacteroidales bacterium]|nr:type II toxin-antitoxin system RelE/ParE family toxin [Bacteroidales bacterium]